MDLRTKRETFFFHNQLTCLVLSLTGKITTVDLRNEASVTGIIEQVDGFMNIMMKNAIYVDSIGSRHLFDPFFVKARNIRYVHIPDDVRIISSIQNQLQVLQKKMRFSEKPKRTFRQVRLARSQKETHQLIEEERKKKDKS